MTTGLVTGIQTCCCARETWRRRERWTERRGERETKERERHRDTDRMSGWHKIGFGKLTEDPATKNLKPFILK